MRVSDLFSSCDLCLEPFLNQDTELERLPSQNSDEPSQPVEDSSVSSGEDSEKRARPADSQQTLIEPVASEAQGGIFNLITSVQANVERMFSFVKEQFCKYEHFRGSFLCSFLLV
jgi:hypothetical protein